MRWSCTSFWECLGKCCWATGGSKPSDSTDLGAEKLGPTRYPGIYYPTDDSGDQDFSLVLLLSCLESSGVSFPLPSPISASLT